MADEVKITPDEQTLLDRINQAIATLEKFAESKGWITPAVGGAVLGVTTFAVLTLGAMWFNRTPTPTPSVDVSAIVKAITDESAKSDQRQAALLAAINAKPVPPTPPQPEPGPVSLPAEVKATSGRMFKLTVKAATDFIWVIPAEAYDAADIHTAGADLLITPLKDGAFSVGAVAVQKGATPVWARIIAGQGPIPPPPPVPPGPTPDPAPIPLTGFRVLLVYDPATLTLDQQGIVFGKQTRDYLQAKCVVGPDGKTKDFRIYQTGLDVSGESKWIGDVIQRHPGAKSFMVVSDGKTGYDGPLPATAADAMAILTKIGGQ